jgi:hypothetical protein
MTDHRSRRTVAVVALAAALVACGNAPPGAVTKCQTSAVVPGAVQTDILFVVDDSGSMKVHQENLARNFASFVTALDGAAVKNDFQIGITTTSIDRNFGTGATATLATTFLASTSECAAGYPNAGAPYPAGALLAMDAAGHQVLSGPGRILPATSPSLVTDFQRNVKVGFCGSSKEQGLRAARLALSEPLLSGANAGLVRRGSRLAVVIVSDANDCSDPGDAQGHPLVDPPDVPGCQARAEAVADFVQFLRGPIGGETRDVVVATIAAVDPASLQPAACTVPNVTPAQTAENPAPRYVELAAAFGSKAALASVCDASFASALERIAGLIASQTVPLSETPADHRLLAVSLSRAAGSTVSCGTPALDGDPAAATADVVYTPPREGRPAALTFQRACTLAQGDAIHVQVLCAG